MTLNEKKKLLYKEKPAANKIYADNEFFAYWAETSAGAIHFKVPVKEMGELPFGDTKQSQLLIRWLV